MVWQSIPPFSKWATEKKIALCQADGIESCFVSPRGFSYRLSPTGLLSEACLVLMRWHQEAYEIPPPFCRILSLTFFETMGHGSMVWGASARRATLSNHYIQCVREHTPCWRYDKHKCHAERRSTQHSGMGGSQACPLKAPQHGIALDWRDAQGDTLVHLWPFESKLYNIRCSCKHPRDLYNFAGDSVYSWCAGLVIALLQPSSWQTFEVPVLIWRERERLGRRTKQNMKKKGVNQRRDTCYIKTPTHPRKREREERQIERERVCVCVFNTYITHLFKEVCICREWSREITLES